MIAAPQLLVMSILFETGQIPALASAGAVVWATMLYLGLIMTALGYGIWYTLVRRHPVGMVAPFLLLLPVFSVLGAVVILGESLTWPTLVGGSIVISGVAFILVERHVAADASGTAELRDPPAVALSPAGPAAAGALQSGNRALSDEDGEAP